MVNGQRGFAGTVEHVCVSDEFHEECCPGVVIPILDTAEMKVGEISLVVAL